MNKILFSVVEAANMIGIGRSMLYEKVCDGEIRAYKIGRRTVLRLADLEKFSQSLPVFKKVPPSPKLLAVLRKGRAKRLRLLRRRKAKAKSKK